MPQPQITLLKSQNNAGQLCMNVGQIMTSPEANIEKAPVYAITKLCNMESIGRSYFRRNRAVQGRSQRFSPAGMSWIFTVSEWHKFIRYQFLMTSLFLYQKPKYKTLVDSCERIIETVYCVVQKELCQVKSASSCRFDLLWVLYESLILIIWNHWQNFFSILNFLRICHTNILINTE